MAISGQGNRVKLPTGLYLYNVLIFMNKETVSVTESSKLLTILTWSAFIIGLLALLFFLGRVLLYNHNLRYFLNFDITTYPNIARSLIYHHGSLQSWHIGSAPYLFPEISYFYLFNLFSSNTYASFLIFMLLQFGCFMALTIGYFQSTVTRVIGLRLGLLYSLLFVFLILSKHSLNVYGTKAIFASIFLPTFHFAGALLTLLCFIIFLKILIKPRLWLNILLFLSIFLGGISDPLTYIYFLFPMLVTLSVLLLFKELTWKKYVNLCSWLCVAFISSFITYHLLPLQITKVSIMPAIGFSFFLAYVKTIVVFFQDQPLLAMLWLIFLIWAPISIWKTRGPKQGSEFSVDVAILFQFLVIVVSTPLIILSIGHIPTSLISNESFANFLNTPYEFYQKLEVIGFHYLVNYFMFPIYFGLTLLLYKHGKHLKFFYKSSCYFAMVFIIIIAAFLMPPHKFSVQKIIGFRPKLVTCFNKNIKTYGLSNGISDDVLIVNGLSAYSKPSVQIANVIGGDFKPSAWLSSSQVFKLKHYNFVISPSPTFLNLVKSRFGQPNAMALCDAPSIAGKREIKHYYIYVYSDDQLDTIF